MYASLCMIRIAEGFAGEWLRGLQHSIWLIDEKLWKMRLEPSIKTLSGSSEFGLCGSLLIAQVYGQVWL
jgi:hypothetical protein